MTSSPAFRPFLIWTRPSKTLPVRTSFLRAKPLSSTARTTPLRLPSANCPACDREGKIHDGNDRGLRFRHVSGVEELLRNRAGKGTSQLGELELRFGERQPGSCLRHPALGYPNLFFTQLVFQ